MTASGASSRTPSLGARLAWLGLAVLSIAGLGAATASVLLDCLARAILNFGAHCAVPAWWVAAATVGLGSFVWGVGRAAARWPPPVVARAAVVVALGAGAFLSIVAIATLPEGG